MRSRRPLTAAAVIVAVPTILVGCSSPAHDSDPKNTAPSSASGSVSSASSAATRAVPAPSTSAAIAEADVPARITIKSIGVNKDVASMGLNGGQIDPPQNVVQWYNAYPSPGKPGNSIIAGHVVYDGVPDAFHDLNKVAVGDEVTISYKNAPQKTFVVDRVASVDKDDLRKRQDVWGDSNKPNLVLITCDSSSGKESAQHYKNNYVVWAHLR